MHVTGAGNPLRDARVGIVVNRDGVEDLLAGEVSDEHGNVSLSGIPLGRQRLVITHASFRRVERVVDLVSLETSIEVALERGGEIEVLVVDHDAHPLDGAKVNLLLDSKPVRSAVTDRNGLARLSGLDPAKYVVSVSAEHKRSAASPEIELADFALSKQRIQLEDGRVVAGRVVDEHGAGVGEANVGSSDESGSVIVTDAEGRFELTGLGEGPINVFADKPGFAPRQLRGIATGVRNLVLELERPASVRGEIVLQGKARSLMVSACQRDPHFGKELCVVRRSYEPPESTFVLENLPSGGYDLVLEADGHATERVRFTVRTGETISVGNVTLRPK